MSEALCDNWDQHWADFSEAAKDAPATRYRERVCLRLLQIPAPGSDVRMLDIGSGTGGFAELFCTRFPEARLLGLEISKTGVELSARRVPRAEFVQRDLMAAPPNDRQQVSFNATHAVCSEVLEHLDDPLTFLLNARVYMSPNCRLVVTVPGGTPNSFDTYIGHRRHYSPANLQTLLEAAGFEVDLATGVGFPFFNLYRLLTTWRGHRLKQDVSGPPSLALRAGMAIFAVLFRFNLMSSGWQTVAVARRRPD
jgi:2-polyprenyl-3-methyl-5-hydroxy-6-metoxy-1,4-benzoquinol methylase